MKQALVVLALIAISACASVEADSPAQRVFAIQADYNSLLAAATTYESQPRCTPAVETIACSDPKAVEVIRKADTSAFSAISAAQEVVRTPQFGEDKTQSAVNAAVAAIGVFRDVLSQFNILKGGN